MVEGNDKKLIVLTWTHIDDLMHAMHRDVESLKIKIDAVVGISRGGCVPGTILSYKLNVPMYVAGVNMYTMDNEPTNEVIVRQKMYLPEDVKSIVIVDDICDRGDTMEFTYNLYKENCPWIENIITASCILRHTSKFTPTIYGTKTCDDDSWVVYPWDK